jgi:hypothetical protein
MLGVLKRRSPENLVEKRGWTWDSRMEQGADAVLGEVGLSSLINIFLDEALSRRLIRSFHASADLVCGKGGDTSVR